MSDTSEHGSRCLRDLDHLPYQVQNVLEQARMILDGRLSRIRTYAKVKQGVKERNLTHAFCQAMHAWGSYRSIHVDTVYEVPITGGRLDTLVSINHHATSILIEAKCLGRHGENAKKSSFADLQADWDRLGKDGERLVNDLLITDAPVSAPYRLLIADYWQNVGDDDAELVEVLGGQPVRRPVRPANQHLVERMAWREKSTALPMAGPITSIEDMRERLSAPGMERHRQQMEKLWKGYKAHWLFGWLGTCSSAACLPLL